jgi:hypothetical protein
MTVIVTSPGVCAGAIALMLVALFTVTLTADVSPNFTVAPFWKFDPLIATIVPPLAGPLRGVNELIEGGVAGALTVNSPSIPEWPIPHDESVQKNVNVPGMFATKLTVRCVPLPKMTPEPVEYCSRKKPWLTSLEVMSIVTESP